jgi:hypothetical protein
MIWLGTPTWGRIDHRMAKCAFRDEVDDWQIVASPLISMNRNALYDMWVKTTSEFMVQVDDDVEWGPDVLGILSTYLKDHPVVFVDMPDRNGSTNALYWEDEKLCQCPREDEPFYCEAFGAGMFGINRMIPARMVERPFDLLFRGFQQREDISFSLRLQKLGIKPLCIPGLDVIHHNPEVP